MKLMILLLLSVGLQTSAKPTKAVVPKRKPAQVACAKKDWKFGRQLPLRSMSWKIQSTPHADLVQYAWGELLSNRDDNISLLILHYLGSTEESIYVRGYFNWLLRQEYQTANPQIAVDQWPKRPHRSPIKLSLAAMCSLYERAQNVHLNPDR